MTEEVALLADGTSGRGMRGRSFRPLKESGMLKSAWPLSL